LFFKAAAGVYALRMAARLALRQAHNGEIFPYAYRKGGPCFLKAGSKELVQSRRLRREPARRFLRSGGISCLLEVGKPAHGSIE
jgi:hypothetical protein